MDMTFREAESRTRNRHAAQNLAWLRRFTLSLIKQHPGKKHSPVMKRRMAIWNPSFLAEILFAKRFSMRWPWRPVSIEAGCLPPITYINETCHELLRKKPALGDIPSHITSS
jgi:hypothetical protein